MINAGPGGWQLQQSTETIGGRIYESGDSAPHLGLPQPPQTPNDLGLLPDRGDRGYAACGALSSESSH